MLIIMNMQNKLYTMQFFLPPDDQITATPQATITELADFMELLKKFKLTEMIKLVKKRVS